MTWRRRKGSEAQNTLVARLKRKRGYRPPVKGGTRPKRKAIGKSAAVDPATIRNSPEPISIKPPEPPEVPDPEST